MTEPTNAVGSSMNPEPQNIVLTDVQSRHAARLVQLLSNRTFALDLSALGAGKTYTASAVSLALGFDHVVVVCPVSVQPKWEAMREQYGVKVTSTISFHALRSVKKKQPKHGLLSRRDYKTWITARSGLREQIERVEFEPTDKYLAMTSRSRTLLVIDEIQNFKNVTSQFGACRALLSPIVSGVGERGSRALLLSGSPIDKQSQAVTMFRAMGVMMHEELTRYDVGRRRSEWLGMTEIRDFCMGLDPDETRKIMVGVSADDSAERLRGAVYRLFQEVFKPAFAAEMPPPATGTVVTKVNAFYHVHDEGDRAALTRAVAALAAAVRYDSTTGTVSFVHSGTSADTLSALTIALLKIETAKVSTFVRVARAVLESSPSRKVVVCLNYTANIDAVMAGLRSHAPLRLDGSINASDRARVLREFQAPDVRRRVLVGNVHVCSTGIDLDDKNGAFPRTALISPNYSTISLYQLGHRFQRLDTRSDARFEMVYGAHSRETNVLTALARKSQVMKDTAAAQAAAGVVFPGDLEAWEEDHAP